MTKKTYEYGQALLARIYNSGLLADIKIDGDETQCTCTMQRHGFSPHTETYATEDARKLGVINKDNWQQQPRNMLKWAAIKHCARVVFPDVLAGFDRQSQPNIQIHAPDQTALPEPQQHWTESEENLEIFARKLWDDHFLSPQQALNLLNAFGIVAHTWKDFATGNEVFVTLRQIEAGTI